MRLPVAVSSSQCQPPRISFPHWLPFHRSAAGPSHSLSSCVSVHPGPMTPPVPVGPGLHERSLETGRGNACIAWPGRPVQKLLVCTRGLGGGRQLDTGRGVRRAGPGGQTGYQGPGQVSSEQPGAILGFLRET